jgi:hypothetical protein
MGGLIVVVVAVLDLDPKFEAIGLEIKSFVEVDSVRVCWLLVSDSGYNRSKFDLVSKLMQDK